MLKNMTIKRVSLATILLFICALYILRISSSFLGISDFPVEKL